MMTEPQAEAGPVQCLQGDLGGPLGSTVAQQPCDQTFTDASQLWQPMLVSGSDIYKFKNLGTGRCLEARNGAVNGGAVDVWDCTSSESNELWSWPVPSGAPFPLEQQLQTRVSGSTGYCLDVPGARTDQGLQMQIWRCNNTFAQQIWISRPA